MPRRRGDNIPPVSDYAHWNEDAYAMWYQENRYDMMHADEIIEDDLYEEDYYEDEEEGEEEEGNPNHPDSLAYEDVPWGEIHEHEVS